MLVASPDTRVVIVHLSECLTVVLQPACRVLPVWIVMGPVNDTAPWVPFVNAVERDVIPALQGRNSWSNINIVSDEEGLTRCKGQNESLMPAPVIVIGEYSGDGALSRYLNAAPLIPDCIGKNCAAGCWWFRGIGIAVELRPGNIENSDDGNDRKELFHSDISFTTF